ALGTALIVAVDLAASAGPKQSLHNTLPFAVALGLPQRRPTLGHRKRSLPRHRRTREAVRKRIHGLEPQTDIKNVVIDGDEVACELSERLVVDGATRVDHIAGSFLSVAACCASR